MSIDETALSRGELYTIITNKAAKGRKGALFAMIKGTKAEVICKIIKQLPRSVRYKCKEITLDFANNMSLIAKECFPQAIQVSDRFHLHKLVHEALQDVRVKYRWLALDAENRAIKEFGRGYKAEVLENGDTLKQLLVRSRYLLYKTPEKWSESQKERAKLLFEKYPEIQGAYQHAVNLNNVYRAKSREVAYTSLAKWYDVVEKSEIGAFATVAKTIMNNYRTILNFFDNKSTNASAECFNAKIKAFRTQFRGVTDIKFFLFRIAKIFA